ncbi:MAG: class I SAM-dependent methyltransferase [Opitutae bacterium]|nr:class I SAM-dependent methyltransferase [Opitutae bacterium]
MSKKYDFALDMATDNSNSLILRQVRPDSDILEIACAHGRMTKYLHETLHCRVTIVEWDREAGQAAAPYATDARHIGERLGDLEQPFWHETLSREGRTFDGIILADILEHLRDPWKTLRQIRTLLRPDGAIWISVPNVAHNGILIELLQGRFDYREVGLLDNTHLRFFTADSLARLVAAAGLRIAARFDPTQQVHCTELKNSYRELPWYVARYLRRRPGGEIYQFVWELRLA